jgi:proline iminopeptidase
MEKMSKLLPLGQYLYCPNSGHFAQYTDQPIYMKGVIDFLAATDRASQAGDGRK